MPHVKNLIASNPTDYLDVLRDQFKINVVPEKQGDDYRLVSLKYNQIESPMAEPIVQECRGMIVDIRRHAILAHPYNKFWNHGEHLSAPIQWDTSRVQDKLDGSLMILYWDRLKPGFTTGWTVASSGHPVAGGNVNRNGTTFAQLFWQTFSDLGMKKPDLTRAYESCFMLELCTNDNRIVVRHERPRVVCHGARHIASEQEWSRAELEELCKALNWEIVREFPISTADDCLKAAAALNPMHQEGFVVVDGLFNRVKIKSPQYVALHHMAGNGNVTPRRVIELWQAGEVGEFLGYFENLEPDVRPVCDKLDNISFNAWNDYLANKDLPTRKDYAAVVKEKPWSSVCFKLIAEKDPTPETAKAILRNQSVSSVEFMLEKLNG